MAKVLLIHGSCHGAWAWDPLIAALAAMGHEGRAITLPRHAAVTLADQAEAILAALDGPSLVLGHSAGGLPITAAAEINPALIQGLIYLCAYMPDDNASVASLRRAQESQPLLPALIVDAARHRYHFDPAQIDQLFYHDCGPEDRARAALHLVPEVIAPQETRLALSANSQNLPRFYIKCSADRAIPPEYQDHMAARLAPAHRFTLPTGHSPFFAAPEALAALLNEIARTLP